jgi:hypothetical protein
MTATTPDRCHRLTIDLSHKTAFPPFSRSTVSTRFAKTQHKSDGRITPFLGRNPLTEKRDMHFSHAFPALALSCLLCKNHAHRARLAHQPRVTQRAPLPLNEQSQSTGRVHKLSTSALAGRLRAGTTDTVDRLCSADTTQPMRSLSLRALYRTHVLASLCIAELSIFSGQQANADYLGNCGY